jgi:hypothetical protein
MSGSDTTSNQSEFNPAEPLQSRGERLYRVTTQIGCGIARFEKTGRAQLEALIRHGLNPWHKLLDIGCGALCGGWWMIHFLDRGGYHGVEPNEYMFNEGVKHLVEPGLFDAKQPRFLHNDQYDFSGFEERFDFFHAHSIWTHAPKKDIEIMLDGFLEHGRPGARFLTSFKPPHLFRPDYQGEVWVGRSHESDKAGICRHSRKWIRKACLARGLRVEFPKGEKIHAQSWVLVHRP